MMNRCVRKSALPVWMASAFAAILVSAAYAQSTSQPKITGPTALTSSARQQIANLIAEKESRTPAQRKIGSSLIYKLKMRQGINLLPNAGQLKSVVPQRTDALVHVEIRGQITKSLITAVEQAGGKMIYGHVNGPLMRALVPLASVERLAQRSDVRGIHEAFSAMTQQQLAKMRAENLRGRLTTAVQQVQSRGGMAPAATLGVDDRGSVTSQGVTAHRADDALHAFGATGAGVRIGVLSDSDDFKEQSISTGDLPADTITVPGQDGRPGSGEGTAMMEIVHDMAPGAQIFFATAFNSPESFADNIRTLRFTYRCDIIVDDVIYYFESPYQDDIIAHAVNDVMADGALYFSSAGNQGNANDGTSGTWEGDFKKAITVLNALPSGYELHNFGGGVISDRIDLIGGPLILHWSDPGSLDNPQAADDYDLFVLDLDLKNVVVASTDIQDGTGLPFEFLGYYIPSNYQVVVARHQGASDRAIRIVLFGGELALATGGATYGHSSAAGAFGVAAVDVAEAGGGPFTGGPTNPVELYSADGFRRVFFDQNGNAYKPGKYLFKNGGGQVRKKPDVAAADGVSTTLPSGSGLNPFYGTSAAAPHAAAIAGLLKSVKPAMKPAAIRTHLTKSALDNEAPGVDRDSGFGIVDAFGTLSHANAKPVPFLDLNSVNASEGTGDGDGFLEPGESGSLLTELKNLGGVAPVGLLGVLSTTTPGVTIGSGSSTFPAISPFGGTGTNNSPFTFALSGGLACGTAPEFQLHTSYTNGPLSPQTFTFKVPTGQPGGAPVATSYTDLPVPIPDADAAGVDVPITVSGFPGALAKLRFSIDGTSCTTDVGATTVGLDHSWVGDLILTLTSPSGTRVTLASRPGGSSNSGNNFCQTVLDDAGSTSIQSITPSDAPFTGTFSPASPLAAFNGEDPNGTWILNVSDNAFIDTGSVRAFTLSMDGFVCN
jgi:subtilisin-like proprotein convertase family protein